MEIAREENVDEVSQDLRDLEGLTPELIGKLADGGVHTPRRPGRPGGRRTHRDHRQSTKTGEDADHEGARTLVHRLKLETHLTAAPQQHAEGMTTMAVTTVAQLATELNRPAAALLEQLQSAGVGKASTDDALTETDKERLLELPAHVARHVAATNARRSR